LDVSFDEKQGCQPKKDGNADPNICDCRLIRKSELSSSANPPLRVSSVSLVFNFITMN
jgi:hypothetical protein